MTAHKHVEMIKAKADNMDLVVFYNLDGENWFKVGNTARLPVNDKPEYFLCHPKHADVCLHWLNGGEVYLVSEYNEDRQTVIEKDVYGAWNKGSCFMNESYEFRIKPRKEKRWIVTDGIVVNFVDRDAIYPERYQLIEIEVEV